MNHSEILHQSINKKELEILLKKAYTKPSDLEMIRYWEYYQAMLIEFFTPRMMSRISKDHKYKLEMELYHIRLILKDLRS